MILESPGGGVAFKSKQLHFSLRASALCAVALPLTYPKLVPGIHLSEFSERSLG